MHPLRVLSHEWVGRFIYLWCRHFLYFSLQPTDSKGQTGWVGRSKSDPPPSANFFPFNTLRVGRFSRKTVFFPISDPRKKRRKCVTLIHPGLGPPPRPKNGRVPSLVPKAGHPTAHRGPKVGSTTPPYIVSLLTMPQARDIMCLTWNWLTPRTNSPPEHHRGTSSCPHSLLRTPESYPCV